MEINYKFPGALVVGTNHQRSLTKKGVRCCKLLPQCQASFFQMVILLFGKSAIRNIEKKLNALDKFLR